MESNVQQSDKGSQPPTAEAKLPPIAHLLCGWPLLLVIVGGAIGGLLGGAAYGLNVMLYKAKLPLVAKILLNLLTGCAAFGIWLAIALSLQKLR